MAAHKKSTMASADRSLDVSVASSAVLSATHEINDLHFLREIGRLIKLSDFLTDEALSLPDSVVSGLSWLKMVQYSEKGRSPSYEEWRELEGNKQELFRMLTPALRLKFLGLDTPRWFPKLAITLIGAAVVLLISVYPLVDYFEEKALLPLYLGWLVCLGALGALAFIAMNALSIQKDASFDLTNQNLVKLRIVLGSLFGLVLGLPFGYEAFLNFFRSIFEPASSISHDHKDTPSVVTQALFLLLPFVIGFSTSLVIMVLNRMLDSAQTLFGRDKEPIVAPQYNRPNTAGTANSIGRDADRPAASAPADSHVPSAQGLPSASSPPKGSAHPSAPSTFGSTGD